MSVTIMTKQRGGGELRARIYPISRHVFIEMLLRYRGLPDAIAIPELDYRSNLPEDAEVISCHYDENFAALCIVVTHPSFDVVSDGERIPLMDEAIMTKYRTVKVCKDVAISVDGMGLEELKQIRKTIDERVYDLEHGR